MNVKEITSHKFANAIKGYKIDEVDEFLKELSAEFSSLQKENRDLDKKLEVLADKIREYRNDEDALKEALLGAQRQGHIAIAEAKEKAEKIILDAKNEAEEIMTKNTEECNKVKEESEKELLLLKEKKERLIIEANEKVEQIEDEMRIKVEINNETILRMKNEVNDYRKRLNDSYRKQIASIESLPEECENEYINKTLAMYQKEKNVTLQKQSSKSISAKENKDTDEEEKDAAKIFENLTLNVKEEKKPISFEFKMDENDNDNAMTETSELMFQPVFEEDDDNAGDTVEEFVPENNISKSANTNNEGGENLFFKKSNYAYQKNNTPLEFGSNAKTAKKK